MRIAVHAFDGMTMFHLSVPLLVFGEVGRQGLATGWEVATWNPTGSSIRTAEGLTVDGVGGPEQVAQADLLVFPSWPDDLPATDGTLRTLVRDTHARGGRVMGLCLGAFPVVDAGILDGRSAVTHWGAARDLAARRPDVAVSPDELYVDHGDVLTSAGTASAIDACLHVVRSELGAAAAGAVARQLVVAPHRDGGQAQYVARPVPDSHDTGRLGPTLDWALVHLDEDLSLDRLAAHASMSRRNLTRRFLQATGTTPSRWLLARRLDESRRLLETTTLAIAQVAQACGFGSAVTFRQNFVAAYGTTPTSYRRRFTG